MAEPSQEPIRVEMPDGKVVTFPPGTSEETIVAEARRRAAPQPQKTLLSKETGQEILQGVKRSLIKGAFLQAEPEFLAPAGAIGGALAGGGVLGATIGGAGGEAAAQIERRMLGEPVPETSREAFEDITSQGALQGAIEAGTLGLGAGLGLAGKTLRPTLEAGVKRATEIAERQGIPLRIGQIAQGPLASIENIIKKMAFTGGMFRKSDLEANAAVNKWINSEVAKISSVDDRVTAGKMLAESLQETEKLAGKQLAKAEDAIIAGTGDAPVRISNESKKGILDTLIKLEGLEGAVPGVKQSAKDIQSIIFPTNRPITYSEAILEARRLGELSRASSNRVVSGLTGKARGELLDSITKSLDDGGMAGEATAFKSARQRYAQIQDAFEESYIKRLVRTKRGMEALGTSLASPTAGITRAESIKTVLGEVPAPTRRAFVETILKRVRKEGEVITGGKLEMEISNKIGEDTIRSVLTKEEADFLIKDLKPVVNLLDIPSSAVRPASSQPVPLLAQGGAAAIFGFSGSPAISAVILGTPLVLATLVTNVEGRAILSALAKAPAKSQLFSSLLGRALSVAYNIQKQEEKKTLQSTGPQKP